MKEFNFTLYDVVQYPYRTARVFGTVITLDRRSEVAKALETALAERSGATPDNHTAYKLSYWGQKDAPPLYVACSDFSIRIGTMLLEERW